MRKNAFAEQASRKSGGVDREGQVAPGQVGASAAARHKATPRMSNAMRSIQKTPASAAVSPPQTAPRGVKSGKFRRPDVKALTAGTGQAALAVASASAAAISATDGKEGQRGAPSQALAAVAGGSDPAGWDSSNVLVIAGVDAN